MTHDIKRVVVTGTVGVGKTTLIRSISDIKTVDTERKATDETKLLKPNTTVSMHFGRIQMNNSTIVHLFGTPGQLRFDFMWDLLISRANACILLVSANRPHESDRTRQIIDFINKRVQIPMVVGMTHADFPGALNAERIARNIGYGHVSNRPPFVTVNPTQPISIKKLLQVVLKQLTPKQQNQKPFRKISKYNLTNISKVNKLKNLSQVKFY